MMSKKKWKKMLPYSIIRRLTDKFSYRVDANWLWESSQKKIF